MLIAQKSWCDLPVPVCPAILPCLLL